MHTLPRIITVSSVLLLAACSSYEVEYPLPPQTSSADSSAAVSSKPMAKAESSTQATLPKSVIINVPFGSQAPMGEWDAVHEQACEEAALALVHAYLEGKTVTPVEMESRIRNIISYESEHGYQVDVTVAQLKTIAAEMFGLKGRILENVTAMTLKRELAAGNPIIIPAAGRLLHNPYYSGEGPPYHMIVVIGYDEENFITQDVGTKRGEHYPYSYTTLVEAIHDWTGSDDMIATGPKDALVLTK